MSGWGAHTHDLDRDLSLARYRGDAAEVERLERRIAEVRARCGHTGAPLDRATCVWCGAPLAPGLKKAVAPTIAPELVRRGA